MPTTIYRYSWGNNPKRETMKGRLCVLLCSGEKRSVGIEFIDNGQLECVSSRSIRRLPDCDCEEFGERAAIIEFEGKETTAIAERLARKQMCCECINKQSDEETRVELESRICVLRTHPDPIESEYKKLLCDIEKFCDCKIKRGEEEGELCTFNDEDKS